MVGGDLWEEHAVAVYCIGSSYKEEIKEEDYEEGEKDRIWFRARTICS